MTRVDPALDPGLQNERTSLAWRRTALSLLVAAATMAKVTASSWQHGAVVWLLIGVPGALLVLVSSSTTYTGRQVDALAGEPSTMVVVAAVTTVAFGCLSLGYVLS